MLLLVCKLCINSGKNGLVDCLISLVGSAIGNKHLVMLSTVHTFTNVGLKEQVFSRCKVLICYSVAIYWMKNLKMNILLTYYYRQSKQEFDENNSPLTIQELLKS
jgi:hypothetical protein